MSLWSAVEAAKATGGTTTGDWTATSVSIDTRSIAPGALFVALSDQRDGHDFVADALKKGAAAAMVSRRPEGIGADASLLMVPDVQEGLEALARAARARTAAKVIGVTGSVGKTSTKEMLRAALAGQGKVHAAEKSFNNQWGVPLTLARMPVDTDFAVVEIGMNHPGEIGPLARLAAPDVALITTVAAAHLEAFADLAGIAQEKAAIFEGLRAGGVAVINGDLETTEILAGAAVTAGAPIVRFGESEAVEFRARKIRIFPDTTVVEAKLGGTDVIFKLGSPGRHFAVNALGVLAVASALQLDLALAAVDLGSWAPPAGRGTRERLSLDIVDERLSFCLIDDAYNANPASMAAALEVLAATKPVDGIGRVSQGRRIAVLGDMLELGVTELALHGALANLASMGDISLVHCVGPRMRALYSELPPAQRGQWVETAPELAATVHRLIDAGDVILVKGSLGSKVSLVVDAIRKLGHPLAELGEEHR